MSTAVYNYSFFANPNIIYSPPPQRILNRLYLSDLQNFSCVLRCVFFYLGLTSFCACQQFITYLCDSAESANAPICVGIVRIKRSKTERITFAHQKLDFSFCIFSPLSISVNAIFVLCSCLWMCGLPPRRKPAKWFYVSMSDWIHSSGISSLLLLILHAELLLIFSAVQTWIAFRKRC